MSLFSSWKLKWDISCFRDIFEHSLRILVSDAVSDIRMWHIIQNFSVVKPHICRLWMSLTPFIDVISFIISLVVFSSNGFPSSIIFIPLLNNSNIIFDIITKYKIPHKGSKNTNPGIKNINKETVNIEKEYSISDKRCNTAVTT